MKKLLFILSLLFFTCVTVATVLAQEATHTPTPTPSPGESTESQKKALEDRIKELQNKVNDLQQQGSTLKSQITVMDNQVKLTEFRINATKQELSGLEDDIEVAEGKVSKLEGSLDKITKTLLSRIVATYQVGNIPQMHVILAANNMEDYLARANYLRLVQAHDKELLMNTQQAKMDYQNQKEIFEQKKAKVESLKQQLEGYTLQLEQEKKGKQKLLEETKGQEKNYQELLAKARSEFEAIQGIVAGNGEEVESGEVSEGQRIASIIPGASCNSSGGHLHFIVRSGGGTVNPFTYLKGVDNENCSGSSCGSGDGDSFNPSGDWNWPIDPKIRMNQGYGSTWAVRNTWVGRIYSFHNGLDITGSSYDVKAVKAGTLYRGSYAGSGGCRLKYVRVKHKDSDLDTLYLHVNY